MKTRRLLLLSIALAAGAWTLPARAADSPSAQSAGSGLILETTVLPSPDVREALALEAGFRNPPAAARPEVFWDWMHDMVTREGITHDLEAMKHIGLAGALIMLVGDVDAGFAPDHNMPNPVRCMSPEFFEHWKFAAEEAHRLGLTLISQCGPGWCHSGGPWITPEQAVQHLVWNDVPAAGPAASNKLALPLPGPEFTRDVAVVAFPSGRQQIEPREVVELTPHFDGTTLTWDVPAGNWTIRRYAMRNASAYNRVAPAGGRGLECDKLSKPAVKAMFEGMVGRFIEDAPQLAGKSILGMEADSWEVGNPEWSPGFRDAFRNRSGYDPLPWLVGFKGGPQIADDDRAARFAHDFQLTRTDLFADNFFSYLTELCREHGMEFMTEAYYGPFDPVRCGGRTVRPMGEFWASGDCMNSVRWAASASHTYGRKQTGAEAFTGRWSDGAWAVDPYALKRVGDLAFCNGLNKAMIHGMALQPWADKVKPGMPMGFWGTMFTPGQTWWEPGRAWVDYLSRCQFMLQQGTFVADILGLFPVTDWDATMPAGLHKLYNYDLCASEMLGQLDFRDGRFVLPGGMSYRVLLLPPTRGKMSPETLARLLSLVEQGGTVVCTDKPSGSPSLQGFPECDREVQKLADRLWGACDGRTVFENRCGQGRLVWMQAWREQDDPESSWIRQRRPDPAFYNRPAFTVSWSQGLLDLLRGMGVPPDVEVRRAGGPAQVFGGQPASVCGVREGEHAVAWTHRRVGDIEVYFVASQVADPMTAELVFRVNGCVPELWDPDSGQVTKPASWRVEDGRTVLSLELSAFGSLFAVFRPGKSEPVASWSRAGSAPAPGCRVWRTNDAITIEAGQSGLYDITGRSGAKAQVEIRDVPPPLPFPGPWTVQFPPGWGAPPETTMELHSWTAHPDNGVRYFSGTAVYLRDFDLPAGFLAEGIVPALDLGAVKNLAEVVVNGTTAAILWKPPFRVPLAGLVKPGRNHLEIKVTNLWINRLVGDELHPDDCEWNPFRFNCNDLAGQSIRRIPDWVWSGGPRPQANRHAFTTWKFYSWSTPLPPAGLMGPVTLSAARLKTVPALTKPNL